MARCCLRSMAGRASLGRLGGEQVGQTDEEGFKEVPDPALATRFGGNGTVVFFGLAKPVRTPLIGPPTTP